MANREIGSVSFSAGGKDYTLRYGSNALCELEDQLGGRSIQEAAVELSSNPEEFRIATMRAVLWAGLTEHHDGIQLTQAGQILDKVGYGVALVKISEAIALAFPDEKAASGNV